MLQVQLPMNPNTFSYLIHGGLVPTWYGLLWDTFLEDNLLWDNVPWE